MPTHGFCAKCRAIRPLEELLRVTDRRRVWRSRLVCRPSIRIDCFRYGVLGAAVERIEPAISARAEERPLVLGGKS
jgi:hypothetical protein